MKQWGNYKQALITETKSLPEILDSFLLGSPFNGVSAMGKSLEERGWVGKYASLLYDEMRKRSGISEECWAYLTIEEIKEKLIACNRYCAYDESFQFLFCTGKKEGKFNPLFRFLRNSLAHGRLTVEYDGDDEYYIIDNRSGKGITGRAILKAKTLLVWADLLKMSPEMLAKECKSHLGK